MLLKILYSMCAVLRNEFINMPHPLLLPIKTRPISPSDEEKWITDDFMRVSPSHFNQILCNKYLTIGSRSFFLPAKLRAPLKYISGYTCRRVRFYDACAVAIKAKSHFHTCNKNAIRAERYCFNISIDKCRYKTIIR